MQAGQKLQLSKEVIDDKKHLLTIAKKFPPELNPNTWSKIINELVERASIKLEDVKLFLFTQININSIWETMDMLKSSKRKSSNQYALLWIYRFSLYSNFI